MSVVSELLLFHVHMCWILQHGFVTIVNLSICSWKFKKSTYNLKTKFKVNYDTLDNIANANLNWDC